MPNTMSKLYPYVIPRKKRSKVVKKSGVDEHVQKVVDRINSCDPSFREVDLKGLGLKKRHAKLIAASIARSPHVTVLDLSHNKLRDEGAAWCVAIHALASMCCIGKHRRTCAGMQRGLTATLCP